MKKKKNLAASFDSKILSLAQNKITRIGCGWRFK